MAAGDILYKKLGQSLIDTTVEAVYTVPADTAAIIRHIVINNPSGASVVYCYHDGTAQTQVLLHALALAAGERAEFDGIITMETGDTLQFKDTGQDDVASVTIHGLEIETA